MSRKAGRLALFAVPVLAALAAALFFWIRSSGGRVAGGDAAGAGEQAAERKSERRLYYCPMHPTMVAEQPGECPICLMTLVPMEEEEEPGAARAAPSPQTAPSTQTAPAPQPGRKRVLYRSTMHPSEVSDRPGKDSMGMEMERVEIEEGPPGAGIEGQASVRISTRKQQLIGVRTSPVARVPFVRSIRTVGRVIPDETRLHHVHTKVSGWVESLTVSATGERVRKGQPLLRVYSPELLATQEEHFIALRSRRELGDAGLPELVQRADELVKSSRRRLLLYDLTDAQVEELENSAAPSRTVTLFAPVSGHVLGRNVTHGMKIDPEMNLLDIADLSRVWVLASVYEYELPFVATGQPATMTLSYLPGRSFEGKVTLVYPMLDAATRTAQVRLEFANPRLELKPEMYAEVGIRSDLGERLSVPETAVISSGTRNIVFVAQGEGFFEPRSVRVGVRLPERVEILEGLAEGEMVLTSGNFFVDSESKLKAALEAAAAPKSGEAP
jgi:RND family efflux transporter MFP subunit